MAQRRRRTGFAGSYQKRPVDGQWRAPIEPAEPGLTSRDAHALGTQIDAGDTPWRVNGVRLVQRGACCVLVRHAHTGEELEVASREQWTQLAAGAS